MWIVVAASAAVISPVLGFIALVGPPLWQRSIGIRRQSRTTRSIAHDFPDALDLLVLSIRAGYLPAQAVAEIVPFLSRPLRPSFVAVNVSMQGGHRFADALGQLRTHLGPIAQPLVDSLSAADRYGLPLAPVLERLSLEARQQRRRDTDATARELPVRLALPLVLCTLPSFVLLAIVPLLLGALSSLHT
jgi:tight adherence protein C